VDYKTIYRLVRAGSLPASKIGGMYRIQRDRLEAYIQAQSVPVAGRRQEGAGAMTGERLKCGHCFRLLIGPREIGGACTTTGCGEPICLQCWDEGQRHCAEHRPSDRERLMSAQAALTRGEIPCLVTGLAARQVERAWIARFDERIQSVSSLYHPGTGEIVRVAEWEPFHLADDETLTLMRLLNVGFLDRATPATLPHNELSRYHIETGKLGWGKPGQAILLEARATGHLEAYVAEGFDTRPVDLEELTLQLADLEELATSAAATSIVGLGSPTGWDAAAVQHIVATGGRAYRHPLVLPCLVDLGTGAVHYNPADDRTQQLGFADLFKLPLEAEEVAAIRPLVEVAMVSKAGLAVAELARLLGKPEPLVRRACEDLAAAGRYQLVKEGSLGFVLLHNRD
jgi:excisionase family DNA binding protein